MQALMQVSDSPCQKHAKVSDKIHPAVIVQLRSATEIQSEGGAFLSHDSISAISLTTQLHTRQTANILLHQRFQLPNTT